MTTLLFLTQMLGFLLQTIPVSALCFAPLENDALRVTRKYVTMGYVGGLTLTALVFAALVSCYFDPSASVNTPLVLVQNAYMSATFLVCVTIYVCIVRAPAVQKILVLLLVVHYMVVLFTLGNVALGLWSRQEAFVAYLPYNAYGLVVHTVLLAATLPP